MCLAIYQPMGQSTPEGIIRAAVKRNPDGNGIVYWGEDGLPIAWWSMDSEEFVKHALELANVPALFHCRIGTSGDKNISNCHPFPVFPGGDPMSEPYYLMHNGILPIVQSYNDPHSDTWHFARFLEAQNDLSKLLSNRDWCAYMEDFIRGNKILIAGPHYDVTILNEHSGTWRDGVWYSNTHSFPVEKQTKGKVYSFYGSKVGLKSSETQRGDSDAFGATDDAWEAWGAEAVWQEQVDPSSGVKSQVLIGWRLEDGSYISTANSLSSAPPKQEKLTDAGNVIDEKAQAEDDGLIDGFDTTDVALERLAEWHAELVAAGKDAKLLKDAEDVIEFDISQMNDRCAAHAVLLLMQSLQAANEALRSKAAQYTSLPAQADATGGDKSLSRRERRKARREKRHGLLSAILP